MQMLTRPKPAWPNKTIPRTVQYRKRISPRMFIGTIITLGLVAGAGIFLFTRPLLDTRAADVNTDCTLVVPPNPLTAQGLATPYQLTATDPNKGTCNEANTNQSAFVQGAVIDPATGKISIYNPLVIDKGTQPAVAPVVPQFPAGGIVALWFGFNGNNLTLKSSDNSLQDGKCVNGVRGSIFGQFAYCNAPAFFTAANQAIQAGKLVPPALGTAKDDQPCPTVRDFSVADQDQSDNVTANYLIAGNGQVAQATQANMAQLPNAQLLTNGSDNGLLNAFINPALGCTSWTAPDLADPGKMITALPLNELQAAAHQAAPIALVPANDPMVLNNNDTDLNKLNLYRVGVDQPMAFNQDQASPTTYCQNLVNTGAPRIAQDASITGPQMSPDPAVGNNLLTFLAQRFVNTFTNLNCKQLLGKADPIATKQDGNGVAISATFNGQPIGPQPPQQGKNRKKQDQQDQKNNDQQDQKNNDQRDQKNNNQQDQTNPLNQFNPFNQFSQQNQPNQRSQPDQQSQQSQPDQQRFPGGSGQGHKGFHF
jgi:hypothetical protein